MLKINHFKENTYYPFGMQMQDRTMESTTRIKVKPTMVDLGGVSVDGDGVITKTQLGGWRAGGASAETLEPGEGFEWVLEDDISLNYGVLIGLSYTNGDPDPVNWQPIPNQHQQTIKYGIMPSDAHGGSYRVYESSVSPAQELVSQPAPAVGDVIRVMREDGYINYYVNGVLYRSTAETSPNATMILDFVMYAPGSKIYNIRLIKKHRYRFAFNGMEADDEVAGEGNSYHTQFRRLDSRLGRWLSVDPLTSSQPWLSPYQSMANNPISMNDPNGNTQDWYKDSDGSLKYDENVHSQDDLNGDQEYLGREGQGFDESTGNMVNYHSDGTSSSAAYTLPTYQSNPSKRSNNTTGYIYTDKDLQTRLSLLNTGSNPLTRGMIANEKKGIYGPIYDPNSPFNSGFSNQWSKGALGFSQWTQDVMTMVNRPLAMTALAVGGAEAVPLLADGVVVPLYEMGMNAAVHVYFRWQVYAGTVSGTGATGILLGRNMSVVREIAGEMNLGFLRMPKFVQWGSRTLPMMTYNRLWLNYHLQSGTSISVLTNALGNPTFYTPYSLPPSVFMSMELQMLMRFYAK